MEKLFLLKPDFQDMSRGAENKYFCPNCAVLEGLLSYYPRLREELEIHYVDFAKPRSAIVNLIGEANQSCPVLVLEVGGFINETGDIIRYLTKNHNVGKAH